LHQEALKFGGPPVTNIRNTSSPHRRGRLNQKSSLREDPQFVSWVLTGNTDHMKSRPEVRTAYAEEKRYCFGDLGMERMKFRNSLHRAIEDEYSGRSLTSFSTLNS
jgi:hypothetical protein